METSKNPHSLTVSQTNSRGRDANPHSRLIDEEMEYALLDRMSWQHFIGLTSARDLPDAC